MTAPTEARAEIGDLVRDHARGATGVLTDVRDDTPVLRPRWGGTTHEWNAQWVALAVLARRGTWEASP